MKARRAPPRAHRTPTLHIRPPNVATDGVKLGLAMKVHRPEPLTSIYFYRNRMGDAGFHGIIDQLHHVPQLEVLYGAENQFTDRAFEAFVHLVDTGGGRKINHISMQKNAIGDQGAKYLAEATTPRVELPAPVRASLSSSPS